jgi:acyl carrier protein
MATSRNDVWGTIVNVVSELDDEGIDKNEIVRDARLRNDLGFSSVDSIHLMISLEDAFKQQLAIETLVMRNGEYAEDLSLGALHDHICEKLHVVE